ncbi:MAG: hypothetical protein ACYDBJ_18755 [Aggregatilineales bacterium]
MGFNPGARHGLGLLRLRQAQQPPGNHVNRVNLRLDGGTRQPPHTDHAAPQRSVLDLVVRPITDELIFLWLVSLS